MHFPPPPLSPRPQSGSDGDGKLLGVAGVCLHAKHSFLTVMLMRGTQSRAENQNQIAHTRGKGAILESATHVCVCAHIRIRMCEICEIIGAVCCAAPFVSHFLDGVCGVSVTPAL